MTEQATTRGRAAPPTTGVAAVDAVLPDLAAAFDLPVAEQAAAVGHAHERLRRALDEPGPAGG